MESSGGIFKGALQDSRNEDLAQKFYSSILVKWKDKGWCGAEILGLNPDGLANNFLHHGMFFLQKNHSKQLKLVGCPQVTGAGVSSNNLNKLGTWDVGDVRPVDTHLLNIPIGGRKVCWWRWC